MFFISLPSPPYSGHIPVSEGVFSFLMLSRRWAWKMWPSFVNIWPPYLLHIPSSHSSVSPHKLPVKLLLDGIISRKVKGQHKTENCTEKLEVWCFPLRYLLYSSQNGYPAIKTSVRDLSASYIYIKTKQTWI